MNSNKKLPFMNCKYCNKVLKNIQRNQKFCNDMCRLANHKVQRGFIIPTEKKRRCLECGKKSVESYCSKLCRRIRFKKRNGYIEAPQSIENNYHLYFS